MGAHLPDSDQIVVLEMGAKRHLDKHRPKRFWGAEAGGQLFGFVTAAEVRICAATGPYRGDERARYSYRSDPASAQRAIAKATRKQMIYIGEWHTHAEATPRPSGCDLLAIEALAKKSKLSTNALILLILGQRKWPEGLSICIYTSGNLVECEWQIAAAGTQSSRP